MNKFTPHTGGHLPKLDDFLWLQEAFMEGFGALVSSLIPDGNDPVILTGCELVISGNDYELEEGFVYYEHEIFKVNESSGSFEPDELPCFQLSISYGPDNPVEYLDKELKNVHEVRVMELVFLPIENDFPYSEEIRLEVLIKELLEFTEVNDRIDIAEVDIDDLQDTTIDHELRIGQIEIDVTNLEILATEHESRIDQSERDLTNLQDLGEEYEERLDALDGNIVPIGAIVMTDEVADFDFNSGFGFANWQGWALCNGANGTPDLRGRFIAGLNLDDPDYDSVDSTGGSSHVQLHEADIPRHAHSYDKVGDHGTGRNLNGDGNDAWEKVAQDRVSTSAFGGEFFPAIDTREYDTFGSPDPDAPDYNPNYGNVISGEYIAAYYETRAHENRPPYYVLAYVKKIS